MWDLLTIRQANFFVHPVRLVLIWLELTRKQLRKGQFGLSLGINYQVFDDLVDSFEKPENSDKPLGSDWGTGKLTLPFILLRQVASVVEKEELDGFILGKDPSISTEHSVYAFPSFLRNTIPLQPV